MKKKILSILLTAVLVGSLTACGKSSGNGEGNAKAAEVEATAEAEIAQDETSKEEVLQEEALQENTGNDAGDSGIPLTSKDVTVVLGDQSYAQIILLKELGWLDEVFGKNNITIEVQTFTSGPAMIEAFTANQVQVGLMGMQPVISAVGNGVDVSVLQTSQNAAKNNVIATLADSDIKSVSDLKGKTVATTLGSSVHSLLVWALAQNGLTSDDVNIINADFTAAGAVLVSGEADAVAGFSGLLQTTAAQDGVEFNYLIDATESGTAYQVIVADATFAKEHPDIVENLLVLFDRANKFIKENEEEALKILSDYSGVDINIAKISIDNNPVGFVSEDDLAAALSNYIDFMYTNEFLQTKVSAEDILDFSYFNETGIEVESKW